MIELVASDSVESVQAFDSPALSLARAGTGAARRDDASLLMVTTAVLWMTCAVVGVLGLSRAYLRPHRSPPVPPAMPTQVLSIELAPDPAPLPEIAPDVSDSFEPPALPDTAAPVQAPPLVAVVSPLAQVAFALPVEGPTRVVEAPRADHLRTPAPAAVATAAPTLQTLIYGRGEGKQPAPDYPPKAVREGQEGTVRVRFTVGSNGRVLEAEPAAACAWHLLNEAALRVVRERWRFASGAMRRYEVAIRFELTK